MKFSLSIVLSFLTLTMQGQTVQWAQKGGGSSTDLGKNIAVDQAGNSYVTGTFQNTIVFGPYSITGPSVATNTYVAKYDPNGNVIWLRQFSGGSNNSPCAIVYSANQNCIYVGGKFVGSGTFGTYTLTSSGVNDCFFTKYDLNGNCLWAIKAGGMNGDEPDDIDCDIAGNVFASGWTSTGAMFGGFVVPAHPLIQTFTTSISPAGIIQWLAISCYTAGTSSAAPYPSIKTDLLSNSYITGLFMGTCIFGSQTLTGLGAVNNMSVFVQKISPSGVILWTNMITGLTASECNSISTDPSNNVYVAGNFKGTIDFGGISKTSVGSVNNDMYVAKYNPSGNIIWVNQYGGSNIDYGRSIEVLSNYNMVIAGYYTANTQIGSYTLNSAGGNDGFVSLLDPAGNAIWANTYGGGSSDVVMSVVPDNVSNLYCTGYFAGVNSVYGSFTLGATGSYDVSVFKISLPGPLPVELVSFSVEPGLTNNEALCKWMTASETNNNFFTLEKSKDNKIFQTLKKIDGAGNSTSIHEYNFSDPSPFDGISYYRLSQTDYNGNEEILKTAALQLHGDNTFSVQCFPVAGNGDITITTDQSISEIKVIGLNGIIENDIIFSSGLSHVFLQLQDLKKGMHFIWIRSDEKYFIEKITIE